MFIRSLFFLLLFLNPIFLYSQFIINGKIVDTDQHPIEFAQVTCITYNDSLKFNELTNKDGKFEFNVTKGKWKIRCIYWGKNLYQKDTNVTKSVDLGTITAITEIQLKEVTISGEKPLIKIEQGKLVFDAQNFALKNSLNGLEILKYVPQISVNSSGNISIKDRSTTIFVNDRRLSGEEAITYLQNLRAKEIKNIEVQTSTSSDMDANIEGGVLHIYTLSKKLGLSTDINSMLDYKKEDYYTQRTGININYGSEKWNLYGSTYYNNGNGMNYAETGNHYQQNNQTNFTKSNFYYYPKELNYKIGGFLYPHRKHTIGIEINQKKAFPKNNLNSLTTCLRDENQFLIDSSRSDVLGHYKNNIFNSALYYRWDFDSLNSQIKVLANYTHQGWDLGNNVQSIYLMNEANRINENNLTNAFTDNYYIQLDLIKKWKSGLNLLTGSKYISTNRNSKLFSLLNDTVESKSGFDYTEDIIALYCSLSKNITKKIFARIGCRTERTILSGVAYNATLFNSKQNYWNWFPSALLTYKQNDKLSYQLRYSKSIYRPSFSLLNNFKTRVSEVLYDIGNPELKPQFTHYLEFSVRTSKSSFSVYYRNIPNALSESYEVTNNIIYHSNKNFGTLESAGTDFSYNGKPIKWWFINFYSNISYNRIPTSYYKKERVSFFISSNNVFTLGANNGLELFFDYRAPYIETNKYIQNMYGASISFNQSFLKNALNIKFTIDDIFDTRNTKVNIVVPDLTYDFYQKPLSRSFVIFISYSFTSKQKVKANKLENPNDVINRL